MVVVMVEPTGEIMFVSFFFEKFLVFELLLDLSFSDFFLLFINQSPL